MQSRSTPSGSSTTVIELLPYVQTKTTTPTISSKPTSVNEQRSSVEGPVQDGSLPSPTTAAPQKVRWNHPRINAFRVLASFYSLFIMGLNDGAYGALIPYLEDYYNISYTVVSLVFLSPVIGYAAASLSNNILHHTVGQRGIAMILGLGQLVAFIVISLHPPFPVLIIVLVFAGFGNGLSDSAWNAWIADMNNANEVLGCLHACYGLGAAVSPVTATALITKAGWQWYEYYYLMVGAVVIEIFILTFSFWNATAAAFRAEHPQTAENVDSGVSTPQHGQGNSLIVQQPGSQPTSAATSPWYIRHNPFKNPKSRTAEAFKNKVTLTTALFLLFYIGVEVSIGGWIVTFMLRVRGATPFVSGLTSTGFWLGITVGRLVLGFVNARFFKTEKHAVATYIIICIGLQLLLWLVPQLIVSAVMVGLLGFFLGPFFPCAMVVLTKLLPKRLHVAGIGFAAASGAMGACILPFAVGAIANSKGVEVLQPIILALLVANLIIWLAIPRLPKQRMA